MSVIASEARQSMMPGAMDYHFADALFHEQSFVIANEVKQSMTSECMDCRATLAVTETLFKVRARYQAVYGGLAMTDLHAILGDKDVRKHAIPNRLTGARFG
jgi:hypothetical protein